MNSKDLKVLICDDSALSRKKLKDTLADLGCTQVYEAANGNEAIEVYKQNSPDLVFMDIVMPEKDGIETIKELLAHDPNAKVVMASSVGTQNHLKEAIKAGAHDFLQKPIEADQVKHIVENLTKEDV